VDTALFLVAGIGGSVVLGWLSYLIIERPFLRLKRFFVYSEPSSDRAFTTCTAPTLTASSRRS
jgi:peptidoglycan/LPS O-acetylase OafA/YrhL